MGATKSPGIFSCGQNGVNGSKKNAPSVVTSTAAAVGPILKQLKAGPMEVRMKGLDKKRKFVFRGLLKGGVQISRLVDTTPVPFNGCRLKKRKRQ